jgi:hypothetical protein
MFSRRERDFLKALVRSGSAGGTSRFELEDSFPNPIYRRKLLWGIRRKAARAAEDWELYARAARAESRVLPELGASGPPPLATEPMAALARSFRSLLKVTRRSRVEPTNLSKKGADK